jgi:hypothetical protein
MTCSDIILQVKKIRRKEKKSDLLFKDGSVKKNGINNLVKFQNKYCRDCYKLYFPASKKNYKKIISKFA